MLLCVSKPKTKHDLVIMKLPVLDTLSAIKVYQKYLCIYVQLNNENKMFLLSFISLYFSMMFEHGSKFFLIFVKTLKLYFPVANSTSHLWI